MGADVKGRVRACRLHIRRRLVAIDVVVASGWGVGQSHERGAAGRRSAEIWRHRVSGSPVSRLLERALLLQIFRDLQRRLDFTVKYEKN